MKQEYIDQYGDLSRYAAKRESELSPMLEPYIQVTDEYGQLICGVTAALGKRAPATRQDVVLRDLMADVFDFLYETRPLVVKGKREIAYPLARRAYESLSLMAACHLDPKLTGKWEKGTQIPNGEVRAILGKHPMGEDEQRMKGLYKFFSEATHPNRDVIAGRLLGEGNSFVLGAIGVPSLALTGELALKTLSLWFWFAAFCTNTYRDILLADDPDFGTEYLRVAKSAEEVFAWLTEQYKNMLAEERAHQGG